MITTGVASRVLDTDTLSGVACRTSMLQTDTMLDLLPSNFDVAWEPDAKLV
jgi:hypothetical protein